MAKAHRGFGVTLPYVHSYRNRHGKLVRYFRKLGYPQIPLPGRPGSDEFMAGYNAAKASLTIKPLIGERRYAPGSVSNTIAAYYTDNSFLALAPTTQRERRMMLERFRRDFGDLGLVGLKQTDLAQILGKRKPWAARNLLKTMRGLMQFAVRIGLLKTDPTQGIEPTKAKAGAIHTWTEDEVAIFEAAHGVGTTARLAMSLLLYTAARRGDAVKFGTQHIKLGRLRYRQQKTGRALEIPVHPLLGEIIAATPSNHLTFLVTAQGKPYTPHGFSNAMRRWCDEAGLPQCSAHGLRKAQARRLAEAGCSAHEIASITGHRTLSEVQRYAADADQSRLADAAVSRTRLANLRDQRG